MEKDVNAPAEHRYAASVALTRKWEVGRGEGEVRVMEGERRVDDDVEIY